MPQFDTSTFPSQLFWLLVCFVVLFFAMTKWALPRIGNVLEARQNKIDDDLKKAAARKDEAETVLAEYQQAMAAAHAKAQEALQQAKEEMTTLAESRNAETSQRLAEQTAAAEARIADAKAEALQGLRGPVSELVASSAQKLIGVQLAEADIQSAMDKASGGPG